MFLPEIVSYLRYSFIFFWKSATTLRFWGYWKKYSHLATSVSNKSFSARSVDTHFKEMVFHPEHGILLYFRTCCSALRCVAGCCSALQCAVVCCSVLQCIAVYCSVLHGAAMLFSVWERVAVCCSVLQRVAACCSVLQCIAVYCSIS